MDIKFRCTCSLHSPNFFFLLFVFLNFLHCLIHAQMQQCFVIFLFFAKFLWRNCICLWNKDYPFLLLCFKCFTFWSFLYICNSSQHNGFIITPAVTSNELCIFSHSVLWFSSASDRKKKHLFFPNGINSLVIQHVLLWDRMWIFKLNWD